MKNGLRVKDVRSGIFSTERYVAFDINGTEYALFVDAKSIVDHLLEVQVLESNGELTLIELPRDTFNAGSRITVPQQCLVSE